MADYMAAEITLGGPVPLRLVGPLCLAIAHEGLARDWGEVAFLPVNAEDLLAARRQDARGAWILRLYADEAPYGEFERLEEFLQQHQLPFRRFSDGKYEYDPAVVEYRPATGVARFLANHQGQELVFPSALREAESVMEEAVTLLRRHRPLLAQQQLREALYTLRSHVPLDIPPLETLRIVKGGRRAFRA